MNTGQSHAERMELVFEIFLVVGNSDRIHKAGSPKEDLFWLLRAITFDGAPYRCNTKQTLVQVLKKSPVWDKVKPFIENSDGRCGQKGCSHGEHQHYSDGGACTGKNWNHAAVPSQYTTCTCTGYIQKVFK